MSVLERTLPVEAPVLPSSPPAGGQLVVRRGHSALFLGVVILVELVWFCLLGYAIRRLLG